MIVNSMLAQLGTNIQSILCSKILNPDIEYTFDKLLPPNSQEWCNVFLELTSDSYVLSRPRTAMVNILTKCSACVLKLIFKLFWHDL